MGCDYYIEKGLYITLLNGDYIWIHLSSEKGYFMDDFLDEDEDDYEEKVKKFKKESLTPEMKPIIIFENKHYLKEMFYEKYNSCIEQYIFREKYTWEDVLIIKKVEKRNERF